MIGDIVIFPIELATNRKEEATARYLNTVGKTIEIAPLHELRYIWSQLKAPGYVWRLAANANNDRTVAENRLILRTVALFWAAGVRPMTGELSDDTQRYVNQVSFLLQAYRALRRQQLPTEGDRELLFYRRESAMHSHLADHPDLMNNPFFIDGVELLYRADLAIFCASMENSYMLVRRLAKFLELFCLLPQDVGITSEQLKTWLHKGLVDQADNKRLVCTPFTLDGELIVPRIVDVYVNVYGMLKPLTQGVTLAELGMTESDLLDIKARLETWLPQAIANPDYHGVGKEAVAGFAEKVMPMFDEVLQNQG